MSAPSDFQRRVLLCVTGLTPQVLTETFYALCQRPGQDRFIPTEVHVVTTSEGAERLRLALFGEQGGLAQFDRLCDTLEIDRGRVTFSDAQVHVIHSSGLPLPDIHDPAANAAAADQLIAVLRTLTDDPDSAVHVSLAGGRKTMGFLAGYAITLLGRPQDRLSHVLVNAPFESLPDFYFPPREAQTLRSSGNRLVSTRDARISLADIPFVRLRDGLDPSLLSGSSSYSQLVAEAQNALAEPQLLINAGNQTAIASGKRLRLGATQWVWLYWLASRTSTGKPPVLFDEAAAHELMTLANSAHREGKNVSGEIRSALDALDRGDKTLFANYFQRHRTRINQTLQRQLGLRQAAPYLIQSHGQRPRTGYALGLVARQIRVENPSS